MIAATRHIKKMRGGAQSHLMLGSDGCAYVVKFQNNTQSLRVLANEWLATRLAQAVCLSVPEVEIVDVSQWLIRSTSELTIELPKGTELCKAGYQFGSRFVGGLLPGHTMDYLPACRLSEVINKSEFAGMLVLDKWTSNADGRQAVFHKKLRDKQYTATFIDQGFCFDAANWTFCDAPLRGAYARLKVYEEVTGWDSFEPWLTSIERLDPQIGWYIAQGMPEEWIGGPFVELEMLVERLFARRSRLRDLIKQFRESSSHPFPNWQLDCGKRVAVGQAQVLSWKSSLGSA